MVNGTTVLLFAGIVIFGVVAVPPLLHNVDTGANIIDQLFDVNATNSTQDDILVFQNGTWITTNITQFIENQSKSHVNIGTGAKIIKFENSTIVQHRSLIGTGGITITQLANEIEIKTGGGPNQTNSIANIQTPNGLFEANATEDTVDFFGNGIAISNGSSILFEINATINQINDVNTNDTAEGDVLILNQTSGIWENELFSDLTSVVDGWFPAEDATVDDLTGVDCVNDIVYDFFDNTDQNEYRRDVIEFCSNSDDDDNITWFYIVPKDYESEKDFRFRLLWSDDNSDASAFMGLAAQDCEQRLVGGTSPHSAGRVTCTSSDIEMHKEDPDDYNDYSAFRFTGVTIPQGATILDARLQFHVDETNPDQPLIVTFRGHDVDDSPVLTETDFDISDRVETTASVNWNIPHWENVHDEGPDQESSDLSSIVQEIVDRGGWTSGNAITLMIKDWPDNTGERHAESIDGESGNQAELTVSYSTGGGEPSPVCFEFSLMRVANTQILDGSFIARQTVCENRSGLDQLSTTEFVVDSTDHQFLAEDLVFLRIHRPNDFVVDDFESDVYVLGGSLEWLN